MENRVYNVSEIRKDFPILSQKVNNKPLVYLDNAATTQKPQAVIDALVNYYSTMNANIHRGIHTLAEKATAAYEQTRESVRAFINAKYTEEIIFTKGTTEGVNLIAHSFGKTLIKGDEIIISGMEHHSDMVPWQILAGQIGAVLKYIPITDDGELILDEYVKALSSKTKLVAVNHASNTLGTINPIDKIIEAAHKKGAKVLIDGAQGVAHLDVDVQKLDVDFYVFSAHKMYGPTGTGVLYGKKDLLESLPPYQGGGEMIKEVSYQECSFNELPYKFEAGTPNIADVIAMKPAIDYINAFGKKNIRAYENELLQYGTEVLSSINGLTIVGRAKEKVSVISFQLKGIHHQDIGIILDQEGIAIRTGHHCTQPLMGRLGLTGTSRASFAMYSTKEEIDRLKEGINKVIKMFA